MIISQSNRNFNILTIEKSEDVLYNYNKMKYARAKIPIGERTMKNTTLIYIEKDGKTLLLHRTKKKNDLNHDLWVGIGGHCEEGESPEDFALREAKEETGLTLTEYKYRGVVTFVSDKYEGEYMHLFHLFRFRRRYYRMRRGRPRMDRKRTRAFSPRVGG